MKKVTNGFEMLMKETDGVGKAFMDAVAIMSEKSALDRKTHELAYISVLVSMPINGIQVADALPYLSDIIEIELR